MRLIKSPHFEAHGWLVLALQANGLQTFAPDQRGGSRAATVAPEGHHLLLALGDAFQPNDMSRHTSPRVGDPAYQRPKLTQEALEGGRQSEDPSSLSSKGSLSGKSKSVPCADSNFTLFPWPFAFEGPVWL